MGWTRWERCASLALAPVPLIFSYNSEKSLCGTGAEKGHSTQDDPVNRDVIFRRNLVHDVAVEYSGAPGVIYFYSVGARIEHNEIYNLPCAHSIPRCWHRSRLACHAPRPDV